MENSFFLVSRSDCERGGIYRYRESRDGFLQVSFEPLRGSNWITRSPDGQFLYATYRENDSDQGCAAYRILSDGRLEYLNRMSSRGSSPCHAAVAPNGKYLYCANYSSGSITEFTLSEEGKITGIKNLICHEGSGPRKDRQECAHTHYTGFTPDNRFLAVTDLGTDEINLYPWTSDGLSADQGKSFHVPPGSGPRHLVFSGSGTLAYLVNELGNNIMTLSYDPSGEFEILNTVSTLPEGFCGKTKAAAIRLSPDEKFLYTSNRGHESVVFYRLDPETRFPEYSGFAAAGGIGPRDINYLPGFRKFLAADEFSDVAVIYVVNQEDGSLRQNGEVIRVPAPLAVFW